MYIFGRKDNWISLVQNTCSKFFRSWLTVGYFFQGLLFKFRVSSKTYMRPIHLKKKRSAIFKYAFNFFCPIAPPFSLLYGLNCSRIYLFFVPASNVISSVYVSASKITYCTYLVEILSVDIFHIPYEFRVDIVTFFLCPSQPLACVRYFWLLCF